MQLEAVMAELNLNNFKIPDYILLPEAKVVSVPEEPNFPVIVFINSKSGGQLGGDLFKTFCGLLNENQVALVLCEMW